MTCNESIGAQQRRMARAALSGIAGAALVAASFTALGSAADHPAAAGVHQAVVAGLPLHFEPNVGQASGEVRYLAHGAAYAIALSDAGAALAARSRSRTWFGCRRRCDPAAGGRRERRAGA